MKKFDINYYEDFEKIVNNIRNGRISFIGENYWEIYRGQSKDSYELKSNITRNISKKEDLIEIERKILEEFKKALNEKKITKKYIQLFENSNDYENEWRWLEQAQDYRLISNSSFHIDSEYEDKIAEQRRSFQEGKFSFQDHNNSLISLEKQELLKEMLIKYTINPLSKKDLPRRWLRKSVSGIRVECKST